MNRAMFIGLSNGHCGPDGGLSDCGAEEMVRLALTVQRANEWRLRPTLLCSTAPRVAECAKFFIEELGIPKSNVVYDESLWDDKEHPADYNQTRKLVYEVIHDGKLILVLAHRVVASIMTRFAASIFDVKERIGDVDYGQGLVLTPGHISRIPEA